MVSFGEIIVALPLVILIVFIGSIFYVSLFSPISEEVQEVDWKREVLQSEFLSGSGTAFILHTTSGYTWEVPVGTYMEIEPGMQIVVKSNGLTGREWIDRVISEP